MGASPFGLLTFSRPRFQQGPSMEALTQESRDGGLRGCPKGTAGPGENSTRPEQEDVDSYGDSSEGKEKKGETEASA